ncbi:hypothetical protein CPB83DRAFT_859924 [Crepidotus variabilis]|uniref:Uncharacterized protein n=1 Tax=Crepidotus variabilis TaxID=179855 RepID=A0A9P6JLU0_9AGAR|nr:hypothetical protein CPB83DRAFT_859924 [Crepidotus variabilis]
MPHLSLRRAAEKRSDSALGKLLKSKQKFFKSKKKMLRDQKFSRLAKDTILPLLPGVSTLAISLSSGHHSDPSQKRDSDRRETEEKEKREREKREREREKREREKREREERENKKRKEEAARIRRQLMKQRNLLFAAMLGGYIHQNLRSLLLAALLLALFLELLGWFILTGLFVTFLIYLLLIIHTPSKSTSGIKQLQYSGPSPTPMSGARRPLGQCMWVSKHQFGIKPRPGPSIRNSASPPPPQLVNIFSAIL